MSTPNSLAKFIASQRAAVVKSAAPKFEEIKDNAVEVKRDTPTFDNATVDELRRGLPKDVTTPSGDVTLDIPGSDTLNPKPTNSNQANPNTNIVEKAASTQALIDTIRQSMGMGPVKTATAAPVPTEKQAAAPLSEDDLSQDVLAKVASVLLSTEEGCRLVESQLEKAAGARDAALYMQQAIQAKEYVDTAEMHKAAAVSTTLNRAAAIEQQLRQYGLTEQDAAICIKQATIHEHNLSLFDHPMLKQAYAEGADDQAAMEQSLDKGQEPEIPMGGDQLKPEEIIQLLESMIQSGQITEQEVEAALQEMAGGQGGAPADPAAGPQEAGAPGGAPAPEAAPAK